jgi:hypothetical protein
MTNDQREIRRNLRILEHAEVSGDVSKTCRYFGVGRASFYRWRQILRTRGEDALANNRSVPHNHPNKAPAEVSEMGWMPLSPDGITMCQACDVETQE